MVYAVMAEAQITDKVVIVMDPPCSSMARNTITVVLSVGKQTVRFEATRDNSHTPWEGTTPDGMTFPADRAKASLRLYGNRTGCEKSFAAENGKHEDVAKFIFHCNHRGIRSVNISTGGSVTVTYSRKNADCLDETEHAEFVSGVTPHPIEDIWVPGEELSLRLSPKTQGSQGPGLLVFALDTATKNWPLFLPDPDDSTLLQFDIGGRRQKKKVVEALTLQRNQVATIFIKQHPQGSHETTGNAISIEDERLAKAGLKTVTFKVR